MIIFLEGPPRAGKSYHAVKDHILPALKAGRVVYARLNGLDHAAIAKHLELPESRVRELLRIVAIEEVKPLFTCFGDDPPRFQIEPNALVIIDEVQDHYRSGRQPLPVEQEAFFAKHGHIGLDVVVMSQSMKRLHSVIRERIERKSVITKMTALGKDTGYSVRFFSVADEMGKFEKISHERGEYDPALFPLYKGFQPEATNTGAYTAGSKNVWQVIRGPAIAMALVVAGGIGIIATFFGGSGGVAEDEKAQAVEVVQHVAPAIERPPVLAQPVVRSEKLSPSVALVVELGKAGRPRYAGTFEDTHILEWRATGGRVLDRFTSQQMIALGWTIEQTAYGVVARAGEQTMIFTSWPLDEAFQYSDQTRERIRNASGPRSATQEPTVDAGEPQPTVAGGVISGSQMHAYGAIGVPLNPGPAAAGDLSGV